MAAMAPTAIGETGFVESADGIQIHHVDRGQGEPTLVFVSGWSGESSGWNQQLDHFAPSHRVVALDLPGFGQSGNEREQWSMAAYGADVATVMAALGVERAILVGHSMGAAVILEAAIAAPDRVIGLVPVDVFHDVEEKMTAEDIQKRVDRMMSLTENATEGSLREAIGETADDEVIDQILRTYESASKVGWREAAESYFAWRNNLPGNLERVEQPIHCINSDRFETDIPKARRYSRSYSVTIVPDVGHAVMTEAPEAFNSALESIIETFAESRENTSDG